MTDFHSKDVFLRGDLSVRAGKNGSLEHKVLRTTNGGTTTAWVDAYPPPSSSSSSASIEKVTVTSDSTSSPQTVTLTNTYSGGVLLMVHDGDRSPGKPIYKTWDRYTYDNTTGTLTVSGLSANTEILVMGA